MRYLGQCSCGTRIEGFDREQTMSWKRRHEQDHKRPNWILVLGHGPFKIEVKKLELK